jgi:hypothetical protein
MLHLHAELGGVETMRRFLMRFPFLLGFGLAAFFAIGGGVFFGQLFGVGFGVPWAQGGRWVAMAMIFGILPVAPWVVISPLMVRMIRKRTHQALDVLAHNSSLTVRPV